MQGMVAGKRSRGKPRWEKGITDTFGTMAAASRVAGGEQASISQIHIGSDILTRICSETKKGGINHIVCGMMRTTRYDALCEWNEQEGHR